MSSDHGDLIKAARDVSRRAYAPYSDFHVGAAVRTLGGEIYAGCNVENASYALTCCAERNAIGRMISAGETKFEAIAIYTPTAMPTAPCGACRQVLYEFNPDAVVIFACNGAEMIETTVRDLLPGAFGPKNLE